MDKSLDIIISDHIGLWLKWMECDKKARDSSIDIHDRRIAAQECENLISQKYATIKKIDEYFDGILKRT